MFETVVLGILSSLVATMIIGLVRFRDFFWPYLACSTIYRRHSLRISMAAVLRVTDGKQLLLIKNRQRPESFGPLGGVIKFYPSARLEDKFEFQSQSKRADLGDDLRGFLPARFFYGFMKWFGSKREREVESVTRELVEELQEIDLPELAKIIQALPLSFVRRVHEGVQKVENSGYYQFRYIEVYELNPEDENGRFLTQKLFDAAESNDHLLAVTPREIIRRRSMSGKLIGVHSSYLIRSKRVGPEPVPFYE